MTEKETVTARADQPHANCEKGRKEFTDTGKEISGKMAPEDQPRPTLKELLEKTRNHVMTPEEVEAQRQSWVRGEMALDRDGETTRFAPIKPAEAQGEAPQPFDHKHALSNLLAVIHRDGGHYESNHGTTKAAEDAEKVVLDLRTRVETGAHPSQDALTADQWWEGDPVWSKWPDHVTPEMVSQLRALMCLFAESYCAQVLRARSTPSLPSELERQLQVAHNILRQFGRYCKLPDGKCDTCLKVEAEMLALGGSTPSPDPPQADNVLEGLRYIADSPAHEHGGFHPEAVKTAKNAIAEIERLRPELARQKVTYLGLLDEAAKEVKSLESTCERLREALRERGEERDEWKRQSLTLVVLLKAKCSDEEWATMNAKFDAALAPSLPMKEK